MHAAAQASNSQPAITDSRVASARALRNTATRERRCSRIDRTRDRRFLVPGTSESEHVCSEGMQDSRRQAACEHVLQLTGPLGQICTGLLTQPPALPARHNAPQKAAVVPKCRDTLVRGTTSLSCPRKTFADSLTALPALPVLIWHKVD